jgi:hypothetical protein
MALERPPKYASLGPEVIKSYRPSDDKVANWHTVTSGRQENLATLAARYRVPVEKIIELNFPGSVEHNRVIPEIVNWYLHHHKDFGCPETHDRQNRIFRGGERIAIPRIEPATVPPLPGLAGLPTLAEATKWFKDKILPLRTAAAGLSGNRLWKSPAGIVRGNAEDPNGLCGDTTLFVAEEYYRTYKSYQTSDGYIIGMILYGSSMSEMLNHIGNVWLVYGKHRKETYTYDPTKQAIKAVSGGGQYDTASLFKLTTFDLYYKKAQDVKSWWRDRDTFFANEITIGLQQDFAE